MGRLRAEEQLTKDLESIIRKLNRSMTGNTQDNLARIGLKVAEISSSIKKQQEEREKERLRQQEEKEKERLRQQEEREKERLKQQAEKEKVRLRQQEEKEKNKAKKQEKRETTIQMMQNGVDPRIIVDMLGYNNVASIYQIMKKYNIANIKSVKYQLIFTSEDDETIATKANWTLEAVKKLREDMNEVIPELKKPTNKRRQTKQSTISAGEEALEINSTLQSNVPKQKEEDEVKKEEGMQTIGQRTQTAQPIKPTGNQMPRKDFFELARNITDIAIMAQELQMSATEIQVRLRKTGYYDRKKVVELIHSGKTNEDISSKGGVTPDAVQRVREEEERKIAEQNTPKAMEITVLKQKQETTIRRKKLERSFLALANQFEKENSIANQLQITYYEVMLLLKRYGITPRSKLERLIEQDLDCSAEVIATKVNGDIARIETIKDKVRKREKLINGVSFETQEKLIRQLKHGSVSIHYEAEKLNISLASARAIAEKWERDRNFNIPESIKRRNFTRDMNIFRAKVGTTLEVAITPDTRKIWEGTIHKMLVEYEPFLTVTHYAFISYSYMKMGIYDKGIEIAKEYLDLKEHSAYAVKAKIYEITEEQRTKENQGKLVASTKVPEKDQDQR